MAGLQNDARDIEVLSVAEGLVDEGLDDTGREEFARLFGRYQLRNFFFGVVTLGVVGFSEALATMPLEEGHGIGSCTSIISQFIFADQRVGHYLWRMAIH